MAQGKQSLHKPSPQSTLPAVHAVLRIPAVVEVLAGLSEAMKTEVVREAIGLARARLSQGGAGFSEDDVVKCLKQRRAPVLRSVINASGVVLHTNLGRAPLAERALQRIAETAGGYCNLEFDLERGERGDRFEAVVKKLTRLTGAQDALVVNNCAATVLLVGSVFAANRSCIVSRGELIEIGGSFRLPDVLAQSRARLIEVGTTNRTRVADYAEAIDADTGLLLKMHRSNFVMQGFVEDVSLPALVTLSKASSTPVFYDLGSGLLDAIDNVSPAGEPTVRWAVEQGADIVSFSGDKLFGGPQAGVVVGSKAALSLLKKHPLHRALRIDKLCLAALEATLDIYLDGRQLIEIPALKSLTRTELDIARQATALAQAFRTQGLQCEVGSCVSEVGGGSLPMVRLASSEVRLKVGRPETLSTRLRLGHNAVISRIHQDAVCFDLRCVNETQTQTLFNAVLSAGALKNE
jgi:L-seryl-tRNA(Ser) seleniumtransferase